MFRKGRLLKLSKLVGLFLILLLTVGTLAQASELILHFLDAGQGDSILIQSPAGVNILVDAGDDQAGTQVVMPYLERLGLASLDMVVITHPHFDHIGGLIPVLKKYPVGQVLADGQIHTSKTYERLLTLIYEEEIPFKLARAGDELKIAGLDEVLVLNPQEPFLPGLNNNSVVLQLRHGDIVILLTGDIEIEAEKRILDKGQLSQAQILKVAHHGSRTSSTKGFVDKTQPEVAIISLGAGNVYEHPHQETLESLASIGSQVLRTDLLGTIIVVSDGASYQVLKEEEWFSR
ncbi:MAG: MBL fold metallo-hydrolase [Firmicutes bacterium]|nr:MBL fold metallo-hydrolase [Bacillota bacterium]